MRGKSQNVVQEEHPIQRHRLNTNEFRSVEPQFLFIARTFQRLQTMKAFLDFLKDYYG